MLELVNNFILKAADPIFNWLLLFPRDIVIVVIALLTSASLTVVRLFTTNQEWLGRADADVKRLTWLAKEATRNLDKESAKRYKNTIAQVKMRTLKYEGKPLLIALIPIVLLATWAFARLGFWPPKDKEPVSFRMYAPSSAVGSVAHLVPQEGVQSANGWIQTVVEDRLPEPANWWEKWNRVAMDKMGMLPPLEGVAEWKIMADASKEPYKLKAVFEGNVYEHELLVGQRTYATEVKILAPDSRVQALETVLRPLKPFGFLPGIPVLYHAPAWLVAYLIIAIPFVSIIKKVFHIY